jgi:AcrR family transcriptional regulator
MAAERRTRLTPEERRAQLVALGVAALAERPIEHLTIESLSEEAGVSRALLFHYFGTKQGLHHEVVITARDSMLHATEPQLDLPPIERLRDTLERLVRFVREHRGTFYSLVRGTASGGDEVREAIDDARLVHADRAISVFLELGAPDSALLRMALRSWVALAEQSLVEAALDGDMPENEIVDFLVRSAEAVVTTVVPVGVAEPDRPA